MCKLQTHILHTELLAYSAYCILGIRAFQFANNETFFGLLLTLLTVLVVLHKFCYLFVGRIPCCLGLWAGLNYCMSLGQLESHMESLDWSHWDTWTHWHTCESHRESLDWSHWSLCNSLQL